MFGYIFLLIITAVIIYLSLIFESTGLALLGFTAVLFAVLSFIYLLYARRKIRVKLLIPIKIAEKNQQFGLRAEFYNESHLPLTKLSLYIDYGENCGKEREEILLKLYNLPKGKSAEIRRLSIKYSGNYEFAVEKAYIYDFLGIFRMKLKKKSLTNVLILPEIGDVLVKIGEGVRNFYGEALVYDDLQPGPDQSESFDVREFRDGDKLQRVHWKLSARMDDLMVKENVQPKACPVVLFMPEGEKGENGALDYMASLSFTLIDLKCPHYVVWNSAGRNDLIRVRVDDDESFYFALTAYMQDSSSPYAGERLDRYKEKYKGEQFLYAVLADTDGKIHDDKGNVMERANELVLK